MATVQSRKWWFLLKKSESLNRNHNLGWSTIFLVSIYTLCMYYMVYILLGLTENTRRLWRSNLLDKISHPRPYFQWRRSPVSKVPQSLSVKRKVLALCCSGVGLKGVRLWRPLRSCKPSIGFPASETARVSLDSRYAWLLMVSHVIYF